MPTSSSKQKTVILHFFFLSETICLCALAHLEKMVCECERHEPTESCAPVCSFLFAKAFLSGFSERYSIFRDLFCFISGRFACLDQFCLRLILMEMLDKICTEDNNTRCTVVRRSAYLLHLGFSSLHMSSLFLS